MKTSLRILATIAFLLPVSAQAESALELPVSAQPEVAQTWGPMCKQIGINGRYQWQCPAGAPKIRDHRGPCKLIGINGKYQRICS